ncbi:hypothetical protein HN385_02050 [archaeon]|jgi:dolichol kinase|nr:hypothetical protein [archaeon]MBT3450336.1 hypothetical protein [archaeon]MBT6868889.1 hypothetical protein [archaeon]MBT7192890.1 hypothetical protein [archaeon]MBT7380856.1 hypothetical protein [archaeon]
MNIQELRRQIMHILTGIVLVTGYYFNIIGAWEVFLMLICGILTSFILTSVRIPLVADFLDLFQREEERKTIPGKGAIFFFTGTLLAIKLFEKDIAMAAIMIMTVGDSISHIVGRSFGKIRNFINGDNNKLLEGSLFGAISAFLAAMVFVNPLEAFVASFVAMFAELAEVKFGESIIDDNLLIPLVAGTVIVLMRMFV